MTTDEKTIDKTLRYNVKRKATKISPAVSGKADKNEYLKVKWRERLGLVILLLGNH